MNKTAIKIFAIWARNKLIADITYKAGLLGITEKDIKIPLPQSTQTVQFFDIGTKEPSSIIGKEIEQRKKLVEEIQRKAKQSDYSTAYKNVIEEVAYTWFNRLIAIRFMEVNDYLPTRIRVLSSEGNGKSEPDLVTHAMEASLDYSAYEKDRIMQLKHENKLDELFRMLFIKQCNALNTNLPQLFEKMSDYTELLLNVSFTDKDGVVCHLVNDITEDDFNVSKEGQVEIIGWLYQYYNTEPKDETFALLKKNVKITKERIPAATQLFTPDWIVRYMVENSLGRLWQEGHPNDELKAKWKYYLDEAEQEDNVQKQLDRIREEYKTIKPEDIKVIDPCMGSGHILVYAFDVLMEIYEAAGYTQRDAAKSIVEKNLYGLDIDNRACQLAYFAVMMKARQYNRRILNGKTICHVYAIQESNDINRNQLKYFGSGLSNMEKNTALHQIQGLLDTFIDAKEYGSIINVENYNWELLFEFINKVETEGQMTLDTIGVEDTRNNLLLIAQIGEALSGKYDVVVTNPPYMGAKGMNTNINKFLKENYDISKGDLFAVFIQKCEELSKLNGYWSMITQHSWMFLSSFESLRAHISDYNIINLIHLGTRAFEEIGGAVVQTVAFSFRKTQVIGYTSKFIRLLNYASQREKEMAFLEHIDQNIFETKVDSLAEIAGQPLAYWLSSSMKKAFKFPNLYSITISDGQNKTGNNDMFLRKIWEVSTDKIGKDKKWLKYAKGGPYRKWAGNIEDIIDWSWSAREHFRKDPSCRILQEYLWYREGITWGIIAQIGFRYLPDDATFDMQGSSIFLTDNNRIYEILAFLNSIVALSLLEAFNITLSFQIRDVRNLPYKPIEVSELRNEVDELAKQNIEISQRDWDSYETSISFKHHPFIRGTTTISKAFQQWHEEKKFQFEQLRTNETDLNRIFIEMYDLGEELVAEVIDKDVTIRKADLRTDIKSFISYAVGCMFGRYSLDEDGILYAGGDWDDSKYCTFLPDKDNIIPISDEEYFQDDLVGYIINFVKVIFGTETLENNLSFIAKGLSDADNSAREVIRNYFIKDFFKDHCQVYQKRPIYWLFDSGKQNGFKALVYMHRYDENTIGNLRIDYLHKMQRIYENEIARMQDTIENSRDAREVTAATKRKEKLIKQLQETKEYDGKIAHLALARTSIDLDDGVKVNYEKVQTDTDGKMLDVLAKI